MSSQMPKIDNKKSASKTRKRSPPAGNPQPVHNLSESAISFRPVNTNTDPMAEGVRVLTEASDENGFVYREMGGVPQTETMISMGCRPELLTNISHEVCRR